MRVWSITITMYGLLLSSVKRLVTFCCISQLYGWYSWVLRVYNQLLQILPSGWRLVRFRTVQRTLLMQLAALMSCIKSKYVYIYIYRYIHMSKHICVYTCIYIYTYTAACRIDELSQYIHLYVYTCIYLCHIYIQIYTRIYYWGNMCILI